MVCISLMERTLLTIPDSLAQPPLNLLRFGTARVGRGTQQALSNAIQGLPIMLICDNAAKGLTFDSSGSSVAGVDVKSYLSGSTSSATPLPAQQQQTTQSPLKEVLKPGRNTAAAKIIGIGNWDFIPDLLAE